MTIILFDNRISLNTFSDYFEAINIFQKLCHFLPKVEMMKTANSNYTIKMEAEDFGIYHKLPRRSWNISSAKVDKKGLIIDFGPLQGYKQFAMILGNYSRFSPNIYSFQFQKQVA